MKLIISITRMTSMKTRLLTGIILLSITTVLMLPLHSGAQESTPDHAMSALAPGHTAKRLMTMKRVALFFNGVDPLHVRIFEDFLMLGLMNMGIEVVERDKIEKIIATQILKTEQNEEQNKKGFVGSMDIASAAGADTIMVGNIIDTIIAQSKTDETGQNYTTRQKPEAFMATAHFVDVKSEKIIFTVALDYEDGQSLKKVGSDILEVLKKYRR